MWPKAKKQQTASHVAAIVGKDEPPTSEKLRQWLEGRYGKVVLLLMISMSVAALLMPGHHTYNFPLNDSAIGSVATENIKAPRDITVPDEDTTQRLKEEAVATVLPVYDHDVRLSTQIMQRITSAYEMMRNEVSVFAETNPIILRSDTKQMSNREKQEFQESKKLLEEKLREKRKDFEKLLQSSITNAELEINIGLLFSNELEQVLHRAIQRSMSGMVVSDKQLMQEDSGSGIVVQQIPLSDGAEQTITIFKNVLDVATVRSKIGNYIREELVGVLEYSPALHESLAGMAERLVRPNLTFNRAETEKRKAQKADQVAPAMILLKKGEMILRDGERITARHLYVLRALQDETREIDIFQLFVGAVLFVSIALYLLFWYTGYTASVLQFTQKDLILMAIVFLITLVGARMGILMGASLRDTFASIPMSFYYYLIPSMSGAMLLRFVLGSEIALIFSLGISIVSGLQLEGNMLYSTYVLMGSLVAARTVARARQRTTLLRAGFFTALANMSLIIAIAAFTGRLFSVTIFWELLGGALAGILSSMIVNALTPVVEVIFGYTTDIKLLELANLNHPVLRELMVQAPGSHHHSIIVGSLVEAGAETIGANPLKARVMAYYHDIGKGKNPKYFAENQQHGGENPHSKLEPSMSALILKRHVLDGIKLANEHKLGEVIESAIIEHHGTTRMSYFYEKAKALEDPEDPVKESDYRYPGRKPQSRETALVMLADSVEAAARSISEPNPARLLGVVQKVINMKFTDGQLNECDLTLKDLHVIAREFTNVLSGIHHSRPEYNASNLKAAEGARAKAHANLDQKPKKKADNGNETTQENSSEGLKRLGMS